ncbi:class II aldolase/adducin family protein [Asanoa siamensis]|uniref:Fuculose phosphate aldolase n=1 Tax=Asanoa siamensis TaxID=926357 RepID=A0ABQ4CVP3_9ACTN|nr:class II aldolase/adducin family protein [Asanoa siamensis]GIF75362.1 fuculose phosphate aldolase [Asanoa siamensis]
MTTTDPASPSRLDAGSADQRDLRDQLAEVGAAVVRAGLVVGSGGNLSARHPGSDTCWVTGAGTWLDRLDHRSFVSMRISDGLALRTDALSPSSEVALHLATYRARPDVAAIIHLHPQTSLLLDALGERIRLLTTDHAFYVRRVATVPFFPPGSAEIASAAADASRDGTNCLILSRHGCSVLADSIELAHKRAHNLEEAAQLTYRALVLGRAAELTDQPPPMGA